jgi:hypothetical protein
MTSTLFDFSQKSDLDPLAIVVQALQVVAHPLGIDFFNGCRSTRLDAAACAQYCTFPQDRGRDFAVSVSDWPVFETLRTALLSSGLFSDIANLLDTRSIERVLSILLPQADTDGPLLLAQQSALDLENARRLIEALCDGLTDNL